MSYVIETSYRCAECQTPQLNVLHQPAIEVHDKFEGKQNKQATGRSKIIAAISCNVLTILGHGHGHGIFPCGMWESVPRCGKPGCWLKVWGLRCQLVLGWLSQNCSQHWQQKTWTNVPKPNPGVEVHHYRNNQA